MVFIINSSKKIHKSLLKNLIDQIKMNNSIYTIFENVEETVKVISKYWNNFYAEISHNLPEIYQPEIVELSSQLEKATEMLISELRNPILTLATTGTTSSGKSTLVNMLCGAEIVPVAVEEMSAGIVSIEYSEKISLIIHETTGAVWECGEWAKISEKEIYQRLHQVMRSYINQREKNPNLACPQSTISYPFKFLKEENLQLPQNTKVRIMDLPGLAYVGDEGNARVIRQCREALCIVTYNSEENDPIRIQTLLQEVVEQVKSLGGSPARMLFVLNKIDVFRRNNDWPESEKYFIDKTINSIKSELTQRLKEYTEDIENLQVVKLSTWPALLSHQIQNKNDDSSIKACKKADNNFNGLIEDVLEDLSRNQEKWTRHERNRVSEVLWERSYAGKFYNNLKNHIAQHFPQLVIPQGIERFNLAAGNAVAEWVTQTTNAILNSSEELYQKECKNIAEIRILIERFLEVSNTKLREPFESIDEKIKQVLEQNSYEDPILYLEDTLKKLTNVEPYDSLGEKLYPLYGWRRELGNGIDQVLEAVAKSLETGNINLGSTNFKKANYLNVNLLRRNLSRLLDLGYTNSVAKNGKNMEARTDREKIELRFLNEELNELAIHLNLIIEDVVNQISNQELDRMYQAVVELFRCHLSYIEKGSIEVAPKIAIKFPESQISKVDGKLKFNFKFQAGFAVTKGTWKKEVQKEVRKRVWWKLWLGKSVFYETDYETRSSDNAKIPSVENLLDGWIIQGKQAEMEIVNQIGRWLLEQIDCLKKNVDQIQNDIIDRYQEKLNRAYDEVNIDYEREKTFWESMREKAQVIDEEVVKLTNTFTKESQG